MLTYLALRTSVGVLELAESDGCLIKEMRSSSGLGDWCGDLDILLTYMTLPMVDNGSPLQSNMKFNQVLQ